MKTITNSLTNPSKAALLLGLLALGGATSAHAVQSSAGSGEIAIYTEAAAGDVIAPDGSIGAGFLTHDFDSDDREDASFTRSGADITLNRAGHYLAIYNSRFDGTTETSANERVEIQSHLTLAGVPIPSGWSQGYIRRQNGQNETITAGMAVLEATADSTLQLRSFRTDTTTVGTVTRAANGTAIQLVKLDDTNMRYARLSLAANQVGPATAAWVKVAYDTDDELGPGFTHDVAGDLTLVDAGKYLVVANTYAGNAAERTGLVQRLTLDNAEVSGSKTTVYMRGPATQSTQEGTAAIGMILEATAGQVLRVEGSLDVDMNCDYIAGRCALTVVKLPSVAAGTVASDPDVLRISHLVNQDVNTAAVTALIFDTNDEVSPAFTHSASASAITVQTDGDYLFLGSFFCPDDGVQRGFPNPGWSINGGARLNRGQTGRYSRNLSGVDQCGNFGGLIASNLVASDTVEMVSRALGNAGVNNSNPTAIQAVRLASLFTNAATFEVIVSPLLVDVTENGATASYEMSLGLSPASGAVVVTVTADADTEVSLDGINFSPTVTPSFTSGGSPQTIHVRAFDDALIEGPESATITHAITSTGDPTNYPTGLAIFEVSVLVTDDDVVAVNAVDDNSTSNANEDAPATEALLAPQASLLANDTDGLNNVVSAFDATSAFGAKVNVLADGTFSYDPTAAGGAQGLAAGATGVDTFTYTARDVEGNTDTATVSITVDGENDRPDASDDHIFGGPLENESSYLSSLDLTSNDGIFRTLEVTFPAGSDLRLLPGKTVSQTPSVGTPPGNGFPENAFDGNVGTFTHTQSANNTVDHVWQVDFGQDVSLESVTLFNRTNCCGERLRDITVTVLDGVGTEIFNSGLLNPANALGFAGSAGGSLFVDFAGPITGRTMVVTRTPDLADADAGNGSILSLGEVTVIGSAPGTYLLDSGRLLLNYDASRSANAGRWENFGSRAGTTMDWLLTDVTLDASPGSARAQISAAYEWDDVADRARLSGASDSIHDRVSGADTSDATWEFWVKPANTTQVMTLFETGGGAGFGCIINNGVLEAATELDGATMDGSYVSYDLVADPMGLVGGNPTTEFNQYVVTIKVNGGLQLYVNGAKVDETTTGTSGDWDGGDGAGLGLFGETNHGGFQNGAATTLYDAPFLGQMAAVRLYSGVLSSAQVFQNFRAVADGTDIDGDTIAATGVVDATGALVPIGSQATLASGAQVTMSTATGSFDYNPNGAFSLLPGQTATDTFKYRVTDGNGAGSEASVTLTITGVASPFDDNLLAKEQQTLVITPNQLIKNDEVDATPGTYIELLPRSISGATWSNSGSAGTARNATITGSVVTSPALVSGFQTIGCAVTAATLATLDPISAADATLEFWFKPDAGQVGKKTIFDTGGNGNGFSVVFDADTNQVTATVDGGDDATANIIATASGVSLTEFNQLIVVIDRDGGAEVGAGTGIFEDLLTIYLNNDPTSPFDPTEDGDGVNALGIANDWAGTDNGGLNATAGTTALNENFVGMDGQIAIFRAYSRILSLAEMEANFDAAIQPIIAVSSPTSALGATVTLNPDGSVSVDYSGISLAPGASVSDSFTYSTIGGTATVNVTIEGNTIQEDWRFLYYGDIANAGTGADSAMAANGLTNLQSFAMDLDPTAPAGSLEVDAGAGTILSLGQPTIWVDPADGRFYLRSTRRADFASIPLTITDQFSRNPGLPFEDSAVPPTVIATGVGDSGAAIEAVQTEFPFVLPTSGGKGRYGRVDVTTP